jgi:hypothetical protein
VSDLNAHAGGLASLGEDGLERARRAVARHATDAVDCELLLDILGLLPAPPDPPKEQT